ncbi:CBS domain-containing protein [Winogradskyella endarachnes]|uniref:CBS domain-containing protein n=1 Tax=Winogradskyella endarachnes TaxID=2681965 RepID=A0A6L6UC23_9FLAO|nr:CBS domain-containing protein [Winogradskyella endarachnes]MUU78457.1 CBS domain-containing protein [Winogradskyella endarachnes]
MVKPEFEEIIKEIKEENKVVVLLTKQLLWYFHCERRSKYNNIIIKNYLKRHKIEVVPDFATTYLWGNVELKQAEKVRINKKKQDAEIDYDPINRIKLLPSANKPPISINRDAELSEAITLMMLHDYSQLPVMSDTRKVDGIITWKTIGQCLTQNSSGKFVRDYMSKDVEILDYEAPLFDAIKKIISKETILVRNDKMEISGIVTTTDISEQFLMLTEPFLILEEIENHIRKILDGKFTLAEIKNYVKATDENKEIHLISDLTFGEYIRIMENAENWDRLNILIDRKTFIARLNEVRRIRNDVMHFHPDGISDNDKSTLRETSKFFLRLSEILK